MAPFRNTQETTVGFFFFKENTQTNPQQAVNEREMKARAWSNTPDLFLRDSEMNERPKEIRARARLLLEFKHVLWPTITSLLPRNTKQRAVIIHREKCVNHSAYGQEAGEREETRGEKRSWRWTQGVKERPKPFKVYSGNTGIEVGIHPWIACQSDAFTPSGNLAKTVYVLVCFWETGGNESSSGSNLGKSPAF